MSSGIYAIENVINHKKYIGQSRNLEKRKHGHFYNLRRGIGVNAYFQNAFNKHGENNFYFKVLIYCEPFELTRYEQFFVNFYKGLLYNIREECVDSNIGMIFSEDAKKKMSNAHKTLSLQARENMSNAQKGKKRPLEITEKIMKTRRLRGIKSPMFGKKKSNASSLFYGVEKMENNGWQDIATVAVCI